MLRLVENCEMELDLFDALMRCLRQEDDELYAPFGELRWRHFFESDFMVSLCIWSLLQPAGYQTSQLPDCIEHT